jgi:hypothetical protein
MAVARSENVPMIFKVFLFLQSATLVASFLKLSPLVVRSKPCPFLRSPLALPLQSSSASASVAANTGSSIDDEGPIGLYVHIPYCRRRCRYCSFAIVPIGPNVVTDIDTTSSSNTATQGGFVTMNQNYTAALLKEISNIATRQQSADEKKIPLQTIYFGGGTPSLAPVETLGLILDAIRAVDGPFSVHASAEISIEMDPGTFSKEKLQSIKDMGFNRISMGVQVLLVCCYYCIVVLLVFVGDESSLRGGDGGICIHSLHNTLTDSWFLSMISIPTSPLTIGFSNHSAVSTDVKMSGNPSPCCKTSTAAN